jgi:hypothetical protein
VVGGGDILFFGRSAVGMLLLDEVAIKIHKQECEG